MVAPSHSGAAGGGQVVTAVDSVPVTHQHKVPQDLDRKLVNPGGGPGTARQLNVAGEVESNGRTGGQLAQAARGS